MAKTKVIIRKVASPYSERSGWAAEILRKDGRRFFVAEQFEKELDELEEEIARPRDIIHLIGAAWSFARANGHALSKTLKTFGEACAAEAAKVDAAKVELAKVRKARNVLAQEVADLALPISARRLEHERNDEETKAAFAAAVLTFENRTKRLAPVFNAFRSAERRMLAVLDMSEEERAYFA